MDRVPLSVGMDASLVLKPRSFSINSTPAQPCQVADRMFLIVGIDAALVLGLTSFYNQLHPYTQERERREGKERRQEGNRSPRPFWRGDPLFDSQL
jgi:hypothetical protein